MKSAQRFSVENYIKNKYLECVSVLPVIVEADNLPVGKIAVKVEGLERQAFDVADQLAFFVARDQLRPVAESFRQAIWGAEKIALAGQSRGPGFR